MTGYQEEKCHAIIHATAVEAGLVGAGTGLFGVITSAVGDTIALSALEVKMIMQLGKVFDREIDESIAESIAKVGLAGKVGKGVASLLTCVPVVGAFANSAAASGVVETLGWYVAKKFDEECRDSYNRSASIWLDDIVDESDVPEDIRLRASLDDSDNEYYWR